MEIGRYRVRGVIGEGPVGTVYVAEDPDTATDVAIKVVHHEHCAHLDAVRQFFAEVRAIEELGHPNIVSVMDLGKTPAGEVYLVMELLPGERLSERVQLHGPLPVDMAIHVVVQIADALAAAHRQGLLHRDLRPENVLLVPHGGDPDFVKLTDFGLARLAQGASIPPSKTAAKVPVVRTARYLAPEHCVGRLHEVDHRSDVYALGVLLYHLLAGQPPFIGNSHAQIMFMHVNSPFPSVRAARPDVSAELQAALERAVAKERGDRWSTMTAFRDALVVQLGDPTRTLRPTGAAAVGSDPERRRAVLLRAGAAALALLLVIGGATWLLAGRSPTAPAAAPPAPVATLRVTPLEPAAVVTPAPVPAPVAAPPAAPAAPAARAAPAAPPVLPDAALAPVAEEAPVPVAEAEAPPAARPAARRPARRRGRRPPAVRTGAARAPAVASPPVPSPLVPPPPPAAPRRPSLGTVDDVKAGPSLGPVE